MHALIDADRIAYAFGGMTDDEGFPLEWPFIASRVDRNIESILTRTQATSRTLYLTSDDKSNFRIAVASIKPYKGNRPSIKPFWYEQIRRYLVEEYKAEIVTGMEADDALGIAACRNLGQPDCNINPLWGPVICSVDKDLDMIPGKHFNELHPERGIYEISEKDALRNFYIQCLCGDPVDSIPGLFGVGRKSKLCHDVELALDELGMYVLVRDAYEKRFGSYWQQFLWENAALLWIKRQNTSPGNFEVYQRLADLESLRDPSFAHSELGQAWKTESNNN